MFEGIIGNDHIRQYLLHMSDSNSVGNSFLFAGPEGIGKSLFALEFIKILLAKEPAGESHVRKIKAGTHPDIKHYRPEGKIGAHTIESLRQFIGEVYLKPYEAQKKFFIIHEAHRMLPVSANALLKTFEEPSPDSIIILLSGEKELLLPTVLSRCRTLSFQPIPKTEISHFLTEKYRCHPDEARHYAALAEGSLGKALKLYNEQGNDLRKKILQFMSKGKVRTYFELTDFVKEICADMETTKKGSDKSIREAFMQGLSDSDLTAVQKQMIEKEVEGAVSLQQTQESSGIFKLILSWFRDLHLLYCGGNHDLLLNKDFHGEMEEKILSGEPTGIEKIEKIIGEAQLAMQRSGSFSLCLENVFLKLNFL